MGKEGIHATVHAAEDCKDIAKNWRSLAIFNELTRPKQPGCPAGHSYEFAGMSWNNGSTQFC